MVKVHNWAIWIQSWIWTEPSKEGHKI